ncbi:MAG: ComEC/Rec2 family competence protein, partial [Chlamydiae bacterium]|nr:ComEC/Rec2 family competence protein [Chlamydiota bacterium]
MIKASNFSIRWVWEKHPALLISISFLLGLCFWLNYSSIYLILFTFITTLTVASKKKKISIYVTMIFSFVFGGFNSCFFLHNDIKLLEQQHGVGIFHPKTIKLQKSFFNTSHVHHGVLKYYKDVGGNEFFDIPCQIYSPKGKPAPLGDCNYYLEGILEKTKSQTFIFKPTGPWMKINNTFSLAKLRYEIKSAFRSFIKKRIKDEKISDFYYGLCAGEIDNKMLSHDFAKLGLQHILAISGFHFSLIAIFCGLLLNTVLPKKACSILLIILLSLYFLLLGNTPSVFRAWAAIMIHVSGKLLRRKSNGLNTLGVCLLLELIFFPKNIYNLGFQFSFACTFGILLLTPSALTWISYIFPKRTEIELQQLSK